MTTPTIPYYPITHDDGLDIVEALDAIKDAITPASIAWGDITGTLSNQTDLQTALNAKANTANLGTMASVNDAPSDNKEYARKNGQWSEVQGGGGGGSAEWGDITGDLPDQTDLQDALDAKADADDVYTKTEVDDALDLKADSADVYTKTETDTLLLGKAPVILNSASGSIASFTDGSASPVTALTVAIEPVQEGTGDPSPENVRPISGHTSAVVTRTGKNLLDCTKYSTTTQYNNSRIKTIETNRLVAGSASENGRVGTWTRSDIKIPYIKGPCSVTFSGKYINRTADTNATIYLRYGTVPNLGGGSWADVKNITSYNGINSIGEGVFSLSGTIPEGAFLVIGMSPNSTASAVTLEGDFEIYDLQVELSSTATEYKETNIQQVTIDLGETVYGATYDAMTGTMTVTDANIASYAGETLPSTWISDRDVYAEGTTPTIGAQVVYKLASPQTVTLSPSQMSTLLGQNNVWADTGDVAVEYRADTRLYIDGKDDEKAPLASPALTGTPTAPTASAGDNSTQIATTAFLQGEMSTALAKEVMYFTNQTVSVASSAQIMRIPSSGTNSNITTNTVVLECSFANPAAITSDVSWTSYAGYITFSGTCTSATTANVTLGTKGN